MKLKRGPTQRMHFTERRLAALEPAGKRLVYDLDADGLGVKIEPSSRRTFFWWRSVAGKPTWKSIGDWPEIPLEEARRKAQGPTGHVGFLRFARHPAPNYCGLTCHNHSCGPRRLKHQNQKMRATKRSQLSRSSTRWLRRIN